jgi:hypothetical protein
LSNVVIGATIKADASGAEQSVGSLKKQLREAQNEVQKVADKFGLSSKEAFAAAKKAADLADRIGDAKKLTDAFNPDAKFAAFGQAIQGATGGFTALQGAMGLFGAESDKVQAALLKVQSAMALSQGLDMVLENIDTFKRLGTVIKTQVVAAFTTLRGAIIATGLGAVLVLVGMIAANFDKIKAAIFGVNAEDFKGLELAKERVKQEEKKLKNIEGQENVLKLQGKSEREILQIKIKQVDAIIQAKKQELAGQGLILKAQIEAEKRNKAILKGILDFLLKPLQLLIDGVSKIAGLVGAGFEFNIADSLSGLLFDPEETEKKGKEELQAIEDSIKEMENQRAGFQLSINEIDKKAGEKRLAELQKQIEKEKQLREAANKLNEDLRKQNEQTNVKEGEQRELTALRQEYEEKLAVLRAAGASEVELMIFYNRQKNLIMQKYRDEERAKDLKAYLDKEAQEKAAEEKRLELINKNVADRVKAIGDIASVEGLSLEQKRQLFDATEKSILANTTLNEEQRTALLVALAQARMEIDDLETQAKIANAEVGASALSAFSELVGKQTAVGKALAVAETTISTYMAAQKAYESQMKIADPSAPIRAAVAAGVAIAQGLARVKGILAVKVPGGSGGAPSINAGAPGGVNAPTAQLTKLDQNTINSIGNQALRAFVVESDVTNNQEKIKRINRAARLG